jgi:purine-binding chemotaxis protein CheW
VTEHRYCTFRVDGLILGIEVERVEEVLRDQTITLVPLAHRDVAGLLNLRGQIVTAIDARRRLGLADRGADTDPTVVVMRSGDELVSLLVDRADDVVEVDHEHSEAVPETVSAEIRALVKRAFRLTGGLLLVLDPDQMLAVAS